MARILVNYIYNKTTDEFVIQKDANYVFADMKVAVLETEAPIRIPLVVPIKGILTVVDRQSYEQYNKKYYLSSDKDGNVFEDPNGNEIWLPKNTDISKLKVVNNQLVFVENDDNAPKEKPKKSKKEGIVNGNN